MAEHLSEQIVAAVALDLAAITGDSGTTYWETPTAVIRPIRMDQRLFEKGKALVYAIILDETESEERETGSLDKDFAFDVWGIKSLSETDHPFTSRSVELQTYQFRMERDVEKALLTSYLEAGGRLQAIGELINFELVRVSLAPEETLVDGFVTVGLRCLARYNVRYTDP